VAHRCSDRGSAVIEFISLGVILMIPVAYLVLILARVQAASFAAAGAAREAARAYVTAVDEVDGQRRAVAVIGLAMKDQGFDSEQGELEVLCTGTPCLEPGAQVTVLVRIRAPVPWLPSELARGMHAQVAVTARQTEVVDEFRSPG